MENVYIKVAELNEYVAKYFPKQDIVSVEELIATIEDLDVELDREREKYKDLEQNLQDNYKPIGPYQMYGINEKDFS